MLYPTIRLTNRGVKEAMASRSPIRFLRKTRPHTSGSSGPEEMGVWGARQGQDTVGGWVVQAGCSVS